MRVELVELVDIFCVNGNMSSIKAVNLGSPQDTRVAFRLFMAV